MKCTECGGSDVIETQRGWTVCLSCGGTQSGPVVIDDEKETD